MAKSKPVASPKSSPAKAVEKKDLPPQEILYNKKLRHDFSIIDTWEAGLVLMGSEVKSLRAKDVQWGDAHARIEKGQAWLYGLHIGEYRQAGVWGHQPQQPRKMLLSRKELDRISGKLDAKGLTLIPERLLFRRGYAKVVICLCKGKTHEDKRGDLVKKAQTRDVEREMVRRSKRGD